MPTNVTDIIFLYPLTPETLLLYIGSPVPIFSIKTMDFNAPVSMWTPSPPQRPAMTLIFDLQNLIKSSVCAGEYSPSVISKLFKAFMRYRGNNICLSERIHECKNGTARKQNAFADGVG